MRWMCLYFLMPEQRQEWSASPQNVWVGVVGEICEGYASQTIFNGHLTRRLPAYCLREKIKKRGAYCRSCGCIGRGRNARTHVLPTASVIYTVTMSLPSPPLPALVFLNSELWFDGCDSRIRLHRQLINCQNGLPRSYMARHLGPCEASLFVEQTSSLAFPVLVSCTF